MLAGSTDTASVFRDTARTTRNRTANTSASAAMSASNTKFWLSRGVRMAATPAATSTVTTTISQATASSEERLYVSWPPKCRSTVVVAMLATAVGTPMKNTPCQASARTYWLSKAATPASAAMTSESATLEYQRGARKMYFERLASSPWVSVMRRYSQMATKFSKTASPSSVCATSGCHCTP